jgi:hypothetical protein
VVTQVVPGGPQAVTEEKSIEKLFPPMNERKINPYISVIDLHLLVDLQQKVSKLVPSIT